MIQIYVEGVHSCSVINVDVADIKKIQKDSIIELDDRAWGAGIETFKVVDVSVEEEKITVIPYYDRKITAYPTANKKIYK